jgi:hypothetical protein
MCVLHVPMKSTTRNSDEIVFIISRALASFPTLNQIVLHIERNSPDELSKHLRSEHSICSAITESPDSETVTALALCQRQASTASPKPRCDRLNCFSRSVMSVIARQAKGSRRKSRAQVSRPFDHQESMPPGDSISRPKFLHG